MRGLAERKKTDLAVQQLPPAVPVQAASPFSPASNGPEKKWRKEHDAGQAATAVSHAESRPEVIAAGDASSPMFAKDREVRNRCFCYARHDPLSRQINLPDRPPLTERVSASRKELALELGDSQYPNWHPRYLNNRGRLIRDDWQVPSVHKGPEG